jgi:hypothetical protein
VILNLTIHDSWAAHPGPLSRLLAHLAALEQPAPWTPPVVREPGDDADDLAELLAGMDDARETSAPAMPPAAAPPRPPAPQPSPATPPAGRAFDGIPTTGKSLYRWATTHKALPDVNRVGARFGYPKRVTDWSNDQAVAVYRILTEPAAANGRPR